MFRPDPVLAVGGLGGAPVRLDGVVARRPVAGAVVTSVLAGPTLPRPYGESVGPLTPATSLAVGLVAALVPVSAAVVGRESVGALTAGVVGRAAVDYRHQRGGHHSRRVRTVLVGRYFGGGHPAFGALGATGQPTGGLAAGAVLVAIGGALALEAQR